MNKQSCRDIALHYCVDDLPGAQVVGARLQGILDILYLGKPVSGFSVDFLRQAGLEALHLLASGTLRYEGFRELALPEQAVRIEAAVAAQLTHEAEKRVHEAQEPAREAAMWARVRSVRARDPTKAGGANAKSRQLRTRYGIDIFVENDCLIRLMSILRNVDIGQRLSEEDVVWLSSVGEQYFSDELRTAYHRLEAAFFANEFKKTLDAWMAVNASGHYRKCDRVRDAHSLLCTINVDLQKTAKLKAALCTTHGGVMRDLKLLDEALRLGEKAHAFKADDYRPCTLLGAIHMETGSYSLGQEWYDKAVERGAPVNSVDRDIRNIFFRADPAKQEKMREFLLREDPVRYAWARRQDKQRLKPNGAGALSP